MEQVNHLYRNTANEEFDECVSCGLCRVNIDEEQADGISAKTMYRRFNTITYLDYEPDCE